MKAVVTACLNSTRFFLTTGKMATDIQSHAAGYRDLTDAELVAATENEDPTWGELRGSWHAAYFLSDGSLSFPDVIRKELD